MVAAAETETIVENELYRITFTNRGAQVKSWVLKKYCSEAQGRKLDKDCKDAQGKQWDLDLVNQKAAASFGYPLSLYTYEPNLTSELNQALYQASATGTVAAPLELSSSMPRARSRSPRLIPLTTATSSTPR